MGQEERTEGPGTLARGAIGWQVSLLACAVISPSDGASPCQHTGSTLANSTVRPPPLHVILPSQSVLPLKHLIQLVHCLLLH